MSTIVNTGTSLPHPNPDCRPPATPIAQKIDILLSQGIEPYERHYLLWLKCRDDEVLTANELQAVALIWQIRNGCGNGGEA